MIIDVVYLGEEAVPTTLAKISDNFWWDTKAREGLVISKTFPAAGYIYDPSNSVSGSVGSRGYWGYYWSSSQNDASRAWHVSVNLKFVYGLNSYQMGLGFLVRLFARLDH